MALSTFAEIGSAGSNASGTSLAITRNSTAGAAAGDYVLVLIAKDNTATTDGETTEVTTITDSAGGNGWQRLAEYCNGQGGAAAGAVVSVWGCRLTNAIPATTGTITITMNTTTAKAAMALSLTSDATNRVVVMEAKATGAADGAQPGSLALSGLASGSHLYLRATAMEVASVTLDTPSTGFSALTVQSASPGAMAIVGEYSPPGPNTPTGATSNPTTSTTADCASVLIALQDLPPPFVLALGNNF